MAYLYTFDRNGNVLDPVDQYTSLLWTERFIEMGDFRLKFPYDLSVLERLQTGMWLRLDSSQEVMRIENLDIVEPGTGKDPSITFSGRSLTSFLENRMIRATSYYSNGLSFMYSFANVIKWMNDMVRMACTVVTYNPSNPYVMNWQGPNSLGQYPWVIPNLVVTTNSTETGNEGEIVMQPGVLLTKLTEYAKAYNVGFKLYYSFNSPYPTFVTWVPSNRGVNQTLNPQLILSADFDNIQNIRESRSLRNFKNVAHGWPQNGSSGMTDEMHYVMYAQGGSQFTSGWDRYELMYVTEDDLALNAGRNLATIGAVMNQRLSTQLNKNPYSIMLDGDVIVPAGVNIRGYLPLGDVVTIESKSNTRKDVQVTEIITSVDRESGEKNYATFSA